MKVQLNNRVIILEEANEMIIQVNIAYFAKLRQLKFSLLSKLITMKLYKTLNY